MTRRGDMQRRRTVRAYLLEAQHNLWEAEQRTEGTDEYDQVHAARAAVEEVLRGWPNGDG